MTELHTYVKILYKWWWVPVLLAGGTLGTMLVLVLMEPRDYEASTTLHVNPSFALGQPYGKASRLRERMELAELTRKNLGTLLKDPDTVSRALASLPPGSAQEPEWRERIDVKLPKNSPFIYIQVRALRADTAALVANAVAETGLQLFKERRAAPITSARQKLDQELQTAHTAWLAAEASLRTFQLDHKVRSLTQAIDNQSQLLNVLRQEHDLALADGNLAKAKTLAEIVVKRETELQHLLGLMPAYDALNTQYKEHRSLYNDLVTRRDDALTAEQQLLAMDAIEIVTPAQPPTQPAPSSKRKLIGLGAIGSVLGGIVLAFLLEYLELLGIFPGRQRRLAALQSSP